MQFTNSPRLQAGQSLISMMVGLVISLITIAAMLTLYKVMIEVSGNASRSAMRDGQVSSAILAAQIELQQAGFGVPAGASESSVIALSSVDSSPNSQVVWRFKRHLSDAGFQCAGLRIVSKDNAPMDSTCATPADANADHRGLYWLPAQDCGSAADSLTWVCPEFLASDAAFFEPKKKDGSVHADEVGAATLLAGANTLAFDVSGSSGCLPYAQHASSEVLPSARVLALKAGSESLFSLCLSNIRPTAPASGG